MEPHEQLICLYMIASTVMSMISHYYLNGELKKAKEEITELQKKLK